MAEIQNSNIILTITDVDVCHTESLHRDNKWVSMTTVMSLSIKHNIPEPGVLVHKGIFLELVIYIF